MEGQVKHERLVKNFSNFDRLLQEVMSAQWNTEFTSRTSPQYIML